MFNQQKVTYVVDGETMESIVVRPREFHQSTPCILVCHDWSGINTHTLATCEELAKLGYTAFAVDAYGRGKRGEPEGDNASLMEPCLTNRKRLLARMQAGFRTATALSDVDSTRIATLGYCFGGLCSLDLARSAPEGLVAVISVHGGLLPPPDWAPLPMRARLLLLHGWNDPIVPLEDVLAAGKEFTDLGAQWELHAYGHAMHAFTFEGASFPERGLQHHPLAHRRAWEATVLFLDEVFSSQ